MILAHSDDINLGAAVSFVQSAHRHLITNPAYKTFSTRRIVWRLTDAPKGEILLDIQVHKYEIVAPSFEQMERGEWMKYKSISFRIVLDGLKLQLLQGDCKTPFALVHLLPAVLEMWGE